MSEAGKRIIRSARKALAYARGEAAGRGFRVHVPKEIDVRAVRRKVGMTQETFAGCFGVSKRLLQDWEQGRRQPSGAARAFLTVIDREPKAVRRALAREAGPKRALPRGKSRAGSGQTDAASA